MAYLFAPRADLLAAFNTQKRFMHWTSNVTGVAGFHLPDLSAPTYIKAQRWIEQAHGESGAPPVAFATLGEADTSSEARSNSYQPSSELIRLGSLLAEEGTDLLRPPKSPVEMMQAYERGQEQRTILREISAWISQKAADWRKKAPAEETKSDEDFDDESKTHKDLRMTIEREVFAAKNAADDASRSEQITTDIYNAQRLLKVAQSEHKISQERAKESLSQIELTNFVQDAKLALLHENFREVKERDPPPEVDLLEDVSEGCTVGAQNLTGTCQGIIVTN
jgi:hypothetical protein